MWTLATGKKTTASPSSYQKLLRAEFSPDSYNPQIILTYYNKNDRKDIHCCNAAESFTLHCTQGVRKGYRGSRHLCGAQSSSQTSVFMQVQAITKDRMKTQPLEEPWQIWDYSCGHQRMVLQSLEWVPSKDSSSPSSSDHCSGWQMGRHKQ